MRYVYDNSLYTPCDLKEAGMLFTSDGDPAYWIVDVRGVEFGWTVKCYGEQHEGFHHFRNADLKILKLVPCKVAECEFKFKLDWKPVDQISTGAWVVGTTDLTDLANIDFEFPDATFKATLDKQGE
jgi:hypothetical protein